MSVWEVYLQDGLGRMGPMGWGPCTVPKTKSILRKEMFICTVRSVQHLAGTEEMFLKSLLQITLLRKKTLFNIHKKCLPQGFSTFSVLAKKVKKLFFVVKSTQLQCKAKIFIALFVSKVDKSLTQTFLIFNTKFSFSAR